MATQLSGAALAILLVGAHAPASMAGERAVPEMARVRALTPTIAGLIAEASTRSVTFRSLLDSLARTDGLVYVDEGACPLKVPACLALNVTVAGPHRVLRIHVNPRTRSNRYEFMASIGHELQHAVEVLSDPTLRTGTDLYFFYRHAGYETFRGTFETHGAIRAGHRVRTEVRGP